MGTTMVYLTLDMTFGDSFRGLGKKLLTMDTNQADITSVLYQCDLSAPCYTFAT